MVDSNIFVQSTLANVVLVFAYLGYKLCNRIAGSKCHYDSKNGWDVELPDPEDPPTSGQITEANEFFQSRNMSLRLRHPDYPSII